MGKPSFSRASSPGTCSLALWRFEKLHSPVHARSVRQFATLKLSPWFSLSLSRVAKTLSTRPLVPSSLSPFPRSWRSRTRSFSVLSPVLYPFVGSFVRPGDALHWTTVAPPPLARCTLFFPSFSFSHLSLSLTLSRMATQRQSVATRRRRWAIVSPIYQIIRARFIPLTIPSLITSQFYVLLIFIRKLFVYHGKRPVSRNFTHESSALAHFFSSLQNLNGFPFECESRVPILRFFKDSPWRINIR